MNHIEAMKQALEALEPQQEHHSTFKLEAAYALRQAIAEAEKQVSYSGNGTAGRENMTAPTGFFFQMPKTLKPNSRTMAKLKDKNARTIK